MFLVFDILKHENPAKISGATTLRSYFLCSLFSLCSNVVQGFYCSLLYCLFDSTVYYNLLFIIVAVLSRLERPLSQYVHTTGKVFGFKKYSDSHKKFSFSSSFVSYVTVPLVFLVFDILKHVNPPKISSATTPCSYFLFSLFSLCSNVVQGFYCLLFYCL